MVIYKYSQLPDTKKQPNDLSNICVDHHPYDLKNIGLFFGQLEFLTIHAKPDYKIVYVNAAPGYHIAKLTDLFPLCTFDLWDTDHFNIPARQSIKLYQEKFTDKSAYNYSTQNIKILFISHFDNYQNGMEDQARWCRIMKPIRALIKFFITDNIFYYLIGTIFLQPYNFFPNQTILSTNDYVTKKYYDIEDFRKRINYHNVYNHCKKIKSNIWETTIKKYNLDNTWDNLIALRICYNYLKNKNINSKNETGKLLIDILQYLEVVKN